MTYLKHDRGKIYTHYEGPGWAMVVYVLAGIALAELKATPVYRGTKQHMEAKRRTSIWRKPL